LIFNAVVEIRNKIHLTYIYLLFILKLVAINLKVFDSNTRKKYGVDVNQ